MKIILITVSGLFRNVVIDGNRKARETMIKKPIIHMNYNNNNQAITHDNL